MNWKPPCCCAAASASSNFAPSCAQPGRLTSGTRAPVHANNISGTTVVRCTLLGYYCAHVCRASRNTRVTCAALVYGGTSTVLKHVCEAGRWCSVLLDAAARAYRRGADLYARCNQTCNMQPAVAPLLHVQWQAGQYQACVGTFGFDSPSKVARVKLELGARCRVTRKVGCGGDKVEERAEPRVIHRADVCCEPLLGETPVC